MIKLINRVNVITKALKALLLGMFSLLADFWSFRRCDINTLLSVPEVPCRQVVTKASNNIDITVFVHGTRIFPKFYYQEVYYSPEGLTKVSEIDQSFHMHTIVRELAQADPNRFHEDTFYAFGWNGALSFDERANAGQDLYVALKKLINKYLQTYGFKPNIRLIAHSHGGNVALNVVPAAHKARDDLFRVKELILLGVPCQQATKYYATDPIFEKVHSLSSIFDFFQVIDPQGLYNVERKVPDDDVSFFSERYFPIHPRVIQAGVKMFGRHILHLEFLMRKAFLSRLPAILDVLDNWYATHSEAINISKNVPIVNIDHNEINVVFKPTKLLNNKNR